jgi:phage gp36-like protein
MASTYTNQAAILGEIQYSDLIALTDDAPSTGDINQVVLNQVIQNASGYIDRKLANIYGQQLPFVTVPLSVANMAVTIACYRLYRRREVPDEKNKFYEEFKDISDFLNKVNKGEMHIDDVPARDFPQGALQSQPTLYGNQVFSGGRMVNSM